MTRILLLIVLIWVLYLVIKRVAASPNAKPDAKPEEKFVLCSQCGFHVPISESQTKNGNIICNNPECQHSSEQKNQDGH